MTGIFKAYDIRGLYHGEINEETMRRMIDFSAQQPWRPFYLRKDLGSGAHRMDKQH